jgi:hypothetical protein
MQVAPVFWEKPLSYEIAPRSGPLRKMVTLADVRSALVYDLPPGTTKQPHWLNAGLLVVAASESGRPSDIRVATDALADALDVEGWLSAAAPVKA